MNVHRLRPIAGLVVLATVILGSLGYLWWVSQGDQGPLQASGTVEGVEVRIGPEVSGRVVEVLVEEGQRVEAGQPLFRQDDELLTIQQDLVAATGTASVAAARMQLLTAELALTQLFEDAPVRAGEADLAVAKARDALDDAERRRSYQQQGRRATDETIEGVEAQLELARGCGEQGAGSSQQGGRPGLQRTRSARLRRRRCTKHASNVMPCRPI